MPVVGWRTFKDGKEVFPYKKTRYRAYADLEVPAPSLHEYKILEKLHRTTAGWAPIEYNGWRIEPIEKAKSK